VKLSVPLKVTDYFSCCLQNEHLFVGPKAVRRGCAQDVTFAVQKWHSASEPGSQATPLQIASQLGNRKDHMPTSIDAMLKVPVAARRGVRSSKIEASGA
jgi:hypothetical protein